MSNPTPGGYGVRVSYGAAPRPQPPPETPQQVQARALAVARAFEPKQVVGFSKARIGREHDGGYIMVDDFADVGAALSFGISDDVSWDIDIAGRGIAVHQFDHTVERPPAGHPLFRFHKLRVAPVEAPGAISLDAIVQRHLGEGGRALLKIDIEDDEWPVFAAASPATLERFSQIVCEFHGLGRAGDPVWAGRFLAVLNKLRAAFEIVHVHGNNAQPFVNVANVVMPSLLEVTFASRRHYRFAETDEIFPTALDRPNLPQGPDMRLGSFKF